MKRKSIVSQPLFKLGVVTCLIGLALSFIFGITEIPFEGPAGITNSVLLGSGICLLLLTWIRSIVPACSIVSTTGIDVDQEEQANILGRRQLRLAKLTVLFSIASMVLAVALYVLGVAVAFTSFDFASGTNDAGLIIILTGIVTGTIGLVTDLAGVRCSWMAWRTSSHIRWFVLSLAMPMLMGLAIYIILNSM